jgi:serine O-acetyltransferase
MSDTLKQLTMRLQGCYAKGGVNDPKSALPDRESVARICQALLAILFPGFFTAERVSAAQLPEHTLKRLTALQHLLFEQLARAAQCSARQHGKATPPNLEATVRELVLEILNELVTVRELVDTDLQAAFDNDPAALDRETILLSYPSIEALAVQRFAHRLYRRGVAIVPRMMTEVVHSHTGIDIHPGATIDESFFIDHGTGVVIGETSRIGKRCVLYQGVSLGAWNPLKKDDQGVLVRGQSNKRHPDLEDRVTVYAGATILGGDTVIGHHSLIGGSVWLTHSVEPWSAVTIKDPELVIRKRTAKPSVRTSARKLTITSIKPG